MKAPTLDHIGIAVADLEAAREMYLQLGFDPAPAEELPAQGVRLSFCALGGGSRLELLAPLSPDTAVGKFLAAKGPGIHHLCFAVDDIEAELKRLEGEGFVLIDKAPRTGAHGKKVAFLHPKSTGSVLIELSQ